MSLELQSEVPKMKLKVAMKLLTFYDYRLKLAKFGKIEESCLEFPIWGSAVADQVRKSEARPVKIWVAYNKNVSCIRIDEVF